MKRRKILISLTLAIFSGLLAGFSAIRYLEERPTPLVAAEPEDSEYFVAVATRDLDVGEIVQKTTYASYRGLPRPSRRVMPGTRPTSWAAV